MTHDPAGQLQRITCYETIFREAEEALAAAGGAALPPRILAGLRRLEAYYESDLWKQDFADDEAGILPRDLSRGVLSEDGVWNLLETAGEALRSGIKTVSVAAALIRDGDRVLATQRGYGAYKDWWEFPGGKIEAGETPEAALVREIREELDTEISVDSFIASVEYAYPEFYLIMDCFWCSIQRGEPRLLEHEAAKWLPLDDLRQVQWLPADLLLIRQLNTA